jgi:hypothetical protein
MAEDPTLPKNQNWERWGTHGKPSEKAWPSAHPPIGPPSGTALSKLDEQQ